MDPSAVEGRLVVQCGVARRHLAPVGRSVVEKEVQRVLTEKAWKAEESTKTKMFPRSAIRHRSCVVMNSFTSGEAAGKALKAAEDKAAQVEKAAEDAKKKHDENLNRAVGNTNYQPKKKDNKAEVEEKALEEQARTLFASKMADLKNPPKPAANDAQPAGAGQRR